MTHRRSREVRRVAVVAVLAVSGVACGGASSSNVSTEPTEPTVSIGSTGAATTSVPTTAPAATSPASTSPASTSPASTSPAATMPAPATDTRFAPACTDLAAAGAVPEFDAVTLDALQPLGAEPVVQLELPRVADGRGFSDLVRGWPTRIPGGMLVAIRPYDGRPDPFGVLLAVNADGSVRWRRCLDPMPDIVRAVPGDSGEEFVVGWSTYGGDGLLERRTFEVWSLRNGERSRTWDDALTAAGIEGSARQHQAVYWLATADRFLLLGPNEQRPVEASDRLLVVDLSTMEMRLAEFPPGAIGVDAALAQFAVAGNGELVDVGFDATGTSGGRPRAVETPAGWSTAPADLDAAIGVQARFELVDDQARLRATDFQDVELWRRDDLLAIPFEGFQVTVDGDIVLAAACAAVSSVDRSCSGPTLLAMEAATGRTVWQLEGAWAVSVVADGRALVAGPFDSMAGGVVVDPPPWRMIDLATGEQVGTQTWADPWTFAIGCCDSPENAWSDGGVVFTIDENTIEMWYPASQSTPLQRVSFG